MLNERLHSQQLLKAGDTITLNVGEVVRWGEGSLVIDQIVGKEIRGQVKDAQGNVQDFVHDLSVGPLTMGRNRDNVLQIKNNPRASRQQCSIALEDGKIRYTHRGSNAVENPGFDSSAAEAGSTVSLASTGFFPPIVTVVDGAAGGGFSDGNLGPRNVRTSNEDRGFAGTYLELDRSDAKNFSNDLIIHELGPQLQNHPGGSTLSMALKTKDGHYTVTTVGDSPVYAMMQNAKGEVLLKQLNSPHNRLGDAVDNWCTHNRTDLIFFEDKLKAYKNDGPSDEVRLVIENYKAQPTAITRRLGSMGAVFPGSAYFPRICTFDPQCCPSGYEFKGMLVCSDGVENGVENGSVQKKLAVLLKDKPDATPAEISGVVVEAAKHYTTDNLTAMALLPDAPKGSIIAVADGNSGTAEVSEAIIAQLKQKALDKPQPGRASDSGMFIMR